MKEISLMQRELDLFSMDSISGKSRIRFTGSYGVLGRMWDIALEDIEKNHCVELDDGCVFAAGGYNRHKNWEGLTFNRDTNFSGLLALNALYPEEMLESLKIIRKYRENLRFACTPETELEGVEGVQVFDLDFEAFKARFHKGSAINKTDDVSWIWCAYDLLMKSGMDQWQWLYETAKRHFREFYAPFYDERDGLFFGQPTFIDVGCNGYPEAFGYRTKAAFNNGVWVKASSTNALYYKALSVLAEVSARLGEKDAGDWKDRAGSLKQAIRRELRFADGTFAYFKHRDGSLEGRREVLGTALPVLFDIVRGEEARAALVGYPITAFGAPLLHPFYDNDKVLHNNSAWPFADTFLLLARERAFSESCVDLNLQIMVNAARRGHLYEFRNLLTNQMAGSVAQLWTIAGFANACIRGGLTELPPDAVRLY